VHFDQAVAGKRGEDASRPRAGADSTASVRLCTPSLAYGLRRWVLTVVVETDSSLAISGADRYVGRHYHVGTRRPIPPGTASNDIVATHCVVQVASLDATAAALAAAARPWPTMTS
jgi:hypothetical protein